MLLAVEWWEHWRAWVGIGMVVLYLVAQLAETIAKSRRRSRQRVETSGQPRPTPGPVASPGPLRAPLPTGPARPPVPPAPPVPPGRTVDARSPGTPGPVRHTGPTRARPPTRPPEVLVRRPVPPAGQRASAPQTPRRVVVRPVPAGATQVPGELRTQRPAPRPPPVRADRGTPAGARPPRHGISIDMPAAVPGPPAPVTPVRRDARTILERLLADRSALQAGIVLSELLAPPVALREPRPWPWW